MKKREVPQDNSETYQGHKKLLYAVNENGHYEGTKSSGWEIESYATKMAVDDLNQQTEEALVQAKNNQVSPLAYHMLRLRFDLVSLAQTTGFFQWQIKRHLTPKIFSKLSEKKLKIYAHVMKLTVNELKKLPE